MELKTKIEQLIKSEIYVCQTSLIEELLILNTYVSNMEYEQDKVGGFIFNKKINHSLSDFGLENTHYYKKREEDDYFEIYEWWSISEWLADKLKNLDEIILDTPHGYFWGRSSTGVCLITESVLEHVVINLKTNN